MKLKYFSLTSAALFVLVCACDKANVDSDIVKVTSCLMTEYSVNNNFGGGVFDTHVFEYDSLKRVIKDSLAGGGSLDAWRFSYAANSIDVTRSADTATIHIQLNDDGFPVEVNVYIQRFGNQSHHQYIAEYNSDGTLKNATGIRTYMNDSDTFHLNEIVYTNGNITSYRESFIPGYFSCEYYEDKINKTVLNPTAILYAFIGEISNYNLSTAIPLGGFSPQPFSKNLLKTIKDTIVNVDYNHTYEFDTIGNITRIVKSSDFGVIEEVFKYDCHD